MSYRAATTRYDAAEFRRVGRSGVKLPQISLGLWQNFGGGDVHETGRAVIRRAFDRGVTHFDLANNYGPPPGSAEETFGRVLSADLKPYRDEIIIATKAGHLMWPGPSGEWGSRKHLLASLDQSLKRMGLDYVDIFYSHRPDPETPLEETMGALAQAVRSGKALYVGISKYSPDMTRQAVGLLREMGVPCLIHQVAYSMLRREVEPALLPTLADLGLGCIAFSPLAQGVLTNKYLAGIPADSRAARDHFLKRETITDDLVRRLRGLDAIARRRGQSLAQMALSWVLRQPVIASALIGARTVAQLDDSLDALKAPSLSADDIAEIDKILA